MPASPSGVFAGIGDTPLVELDFLEEIPDGVRLFAKLESTNPGGSIKDRPVARMLSAALRCATGAWTATGGCWIPLRATPASPTPCWAPRWTFPSRWWCPAMPAASACSGFRAHGAELILTDPIEGYDHALRETQRLAAEQPERYWHCDQYSNEENWRAHYDGTGAELLAQVGEAAGSAPDAFVAGVGTGGTITGAGHRLREANPDLHITCVIPDVFPGIEGLKPLGEPGDIVPAILHEDLIDERIDVRMEQATAVCRRLSQAGLFVGPSSGAYVRAALQVAATGRYPIVATILSDGGERYSSTGMWG